MKRFGKCTCVPYITKKTKERTIHEGYYTYRVVEVDKEGCCSDCGHYAVIGDVFKGLRKTKEVARRGDVTKTKDNEGIIPYFNKELF